jgi:hypothetical protein
VIERRGAFVQKNIILCPNTVFDIGYFANDGCCEGGQAPLFIRSNLNVTCGVSGERSNNCTFRGGSALIFNILGTYLEPAENVHIHGVTMEASSSSAVIVANGGDMTLHDCLMQVSMVSSENPLIPKDPFSHISFS